MQEGSVIKQLVVLGLFAAAIPAGFIAKDRPWLPWLVTLFTALPFLDVEGRQSVSFFFDYGSSLRPPINFRGETRGLDICVIDFLSVILLIALPPRTSPTAMKFARYSYLAMAALSITQAVLPGYAAFSVWKLVRAYAAFAVITRAMDHLQYGPAVLRGFALGVIYVSWLAVYQRYGQGYPQSPGTFGHQNTLGMTLCLFFPIFFVMTLEGFGGRLAEFAAASAAVGVLMTLSRSSMGMVALTALVACAYALRDINRRKTWILTGCFALGLAGIAAIGDTLIDRFLNAPEVSGEARDMFEDGASMMFSDHPVGIGINQYSYYLAELGYGKAAGVPDGDEGGIVHNIYWLTLTELGVQGLIAFLLVLFFPFAYAVGLLLRSPKPLVRAFGLGIVLGMLSFLLQGFYEWAARQAPLAYIYWMYVGFVCGLRNRERSTVATHVGA